VRYLSKYYKQAITMASAEGCSVSKQLASGLQTHRSADSCSASGLTGDMRRSPDNSSLIFSAF